MKKNVMMRVASILLVAVLISTCVISGTYAKYVTAETGSDTARVAKWGVEIVPQNDTFGHYYLNADDNSVTSTYTVDTCSVASGNGEKVVAPGTKGSMASILLSGTPEVDVKVTYTADLVLTGWEYEGVAKYCPLKITVGTQEYSINVGDDAADLEAEVEAAVLAYTKSYEAGTDLAAQGADALKISWEWPYESGHDDADTALGDQAADGNAATITLTVTCTVTQVD